MLSSIFFSSDTLIWFLNHSRATIEEVELLYRCSSAIRTLIRTPVIISEMCSLLEIKRTTCPAEFMQEYNHLFRRECSRDPSDVWHGLKAINDGNLPALGDILFDHVKSLRHDYPFYDLFFEAGRKNDESIYTLLDEYIHESCGDISKRTMFVAGKCYARHDTTGLTYEWVGSHKFDMQLIAFEGCRGDGIDIVREFILWGLPSHPSIWAAAARDDAGTFSVFARHHDLFTRMTKEGGIAVIKEKINISERFDLKNDEISPRFLVLLYVLHYRSRKVLSMIFPEISPDCFDKKDFSWTVEGYKWLNKQTKIPLWRRSRIFASAIQHDDLPLVKHLRDEIDRKTPYLVFTAMSFNARNVLKWLLSEFGDQPALMEYRDAVERGDNKFQHCEGSIAHRIFLRYLRHLPC